MLFCSELYPVLHDVRIKGSSSELNQAGKSKDACVLNKLGRVAERPMWVEQAGKGGKRKVGRLAAVNSERAPAEAHLDQLKYFRMATQRGRARDQ